MLKFIRNKYDSPNKPSHVFSLHKIVSQYNLLIKNLEQYLLHIWLERLNKKVLTKFWYDKINRRINAFNNKRKNAPFSCWEFRRFDRRQNKLDKNQ